MTPHERLLLAAVQLAYRKHFMHEPQIGWDELSDTLREALVQVMGDEGYQKWLKEVG